jgi:hypothetical protein
MPGGDQNSVEDTSAVFDVVGRIRELGVEAAIAFIHHKARAGNVRGSTNIEADPDVLTSVAKDGDRVVWSVDRARSIEEGGHYYFRFHNHPLGDNSQGFAVNAPFVEAVDFEAPSNADISGAKRESQALSLIIAMGPGRHLLKDVHDVLTQAGLAPTTTVRRTGSSKLRTDNKRVQEYYAELVPPTGRVFGGNSLEQVVEQGLIVAIFVR